LQSLISGTLFYLLVFLLLQSTLDDGDFLDALRTWGWLVLLPALLGWLIKFFEWAWAHCRARRGTSPSEETARWMMAHLDFWRPSLERGDYAEAERRLRGLLNDAKAQLGPEHPLYRAIHHGHAFALVGLGEDERALGALDEAIALEGRLFGVSKESFAVLIPTLAEALTRTGRATQAEALLRKLLGPDGRLPGEGELRPPPAEGGAAGLSAEAEEALSQFLVQPGAPSLSLTERVRALRLLAGALVVQGRYQEAGWLLERAREKLSTLPPEHPEQWRTLASIGRVLTLDGRGDEAEKALRRADERAESFLDKAGSLDRARILAELARLEHRLGKRSAASTARRALAFYGDAGCSDAERASARQELAPIVEAETALRP
jgi:tetratricopeptide (TPR) repeat protein